MNASKWNRGVSRFRSKLSAFTFITPLFGVVASYFIMHDTLTPVFGAAAPVATDPLLNVTKT